MMIVSSNLNYFLIKWHYEWVNLREVFCELFFLNHILLCYNHILAILSSCSCVHLHYHVKHGLITHHFFSLVYKLLLYSSIRIQRYITQIFHLIYRINILQLPVIRFMTYLTGINRINLTISVNNDTKK